ncbi:hypothetical protein AAZX31_14G153000 [Glycine max]
MGSANGEISLSELGLRDRLVSKSFKIWDISACSLPFQENICLICGDKGDLKSLIYCDQCKACAEHRYLYCELSSLLLNIDNTLI